MRNDDDDKLHKQSARLRGRGLPLMLLATILFAALVIVMLVYANGRVAAPISESPHLLRDKALLASQHQGEPQIIEPPIIDSLRPDPPDNGIVHALQSKNEELERLARKLQAELARQSTVAADAKDECISTLAEIYKVGNATKKQWAHEKTRLARHISEFSASELVRRFGSDPVRVRLATEYGDMVVEMAPVKLMPVVTLYFLDQVANGFWNNMSFFRAESHVIQASNVRPDGSRLRSHRTMHGIPFQEYTPDFPHHKYTLGIAGRPGGPDFYVNMLDNVRIHGPGGQGHNYNGDPESDSCFAKLVSGSEVADKIQSLPYNSDSGLHILVKPARIISATIISGKAAAAD